MTVKELTVYDRLPVDWIHYSGPPVTEARIGFQNPPHQAARANTPLALRYQIIYGTTYA